LNQSPKIVGRHPVGADHAIGQHTELREELLLATDRFDESTVVDQRQRMRPPRFRESTNQHAFPCFEKDDRQRDILPVAKTPKDNR
jgi:hypothetical protein